MCAPSGLIATNVTSRAIGSTTARSSSAPVSDVRA
jgi:hypothetical protein